MTAKSKVEGLIKYNTYVSIQKIQMYFQYFVKNKMFNIQPAQSCLWQIGMKNGMTLIVLKQQK